MGVQDLIVKLMALLTLLKLVIVILQSKLNLSKVCRLDKTFPSYLERYVFLINVTKLNGVRECS